MERKKKKPWVRKGYEKIVAELEDASRLLRAFGLQLAGYDPGIIAYRKREEHGSFDTRLEFGTTEWEWLKPLLQELRKRRRHGIR